MLELRGLYEALRSTAGQIGIVTVRLVTPDVPGRKDPVVRPGRSDIVFDVRETTDAAAPAFNRPENKFHHIVNNNLTLSYLHGRFEFTYVDGRTLAVPLEFVPPETSNDGPDPDLLNMLRTVDLDTLVNDELRRQTVVSAATARFEKFLQTLPHPQNDTLTPRAARPAPPAVPAITAACG